MRAALDPNGADAYWAGRFGLIPLRWRGRGAAREPGAGRCGAGSAAVSWKASNPAAKGRGRGVFRAFPPQRPGCRIHTKKSAGIIKLLH